MATSASGESFRGLLLRHRGRTELTQGQLADRIGVVRRTVQDWESGVNYPRAGRLQGLIDAILGAGGLSVGQEAAEAEALWTAAEREASRLYPPFDSTWFTHLLAERAQLAGRAETPRGRAGAVLAEPTIEPRQEWGAAPDTSEFVGRLEELALLRRWVVDERCRLVTVLGMGGIGKTTLAAKLGQQVAGDFQRVYWRSLRDAPPLSEWLSGAIGFLSDQELVPPTSDAERMNSLLRLLRGRRCLLVLDNYEPLFEPGHTGRYRTGMGGYGRLFEAVAEAPHQSCLVLTSREAPPELPAVIGGAVRSLQMGGLRVDDAQVLVATKMLSGTGQHWAELNARLGGNGLALKVVGETIRELFNGDIANFLEAAGTSSALGGIRRVLAEQIERSSGLEQRILRAVAAEREPLTITTVLSRFSERIAHGAVLDAVEALRRRSLVERAELRGAAVFTLQSVVLEYLTDRLVEEVSGEIARGRADLLVEHPLIQAQAKDYVRDSQERLIGRQVLHLLLTENDKTGTERLLLTLLDGWRGRPIPAQGFGPGNVVNLLRLLRGDLCGLDLSRLAIRQAYLADVDARDTSVVDANLSESVLAEAFNFGGSVALSADGGMFAAGTFTGQVCMWRLADRMPLWASQGHIGGVWTVALSANGRLVASSGSDGLVRLWEAGSGHEVGTLSGHAGTVGGVALSADGRLVASGGDDGTVRLWDATTGHELSVLTGHAGAVWRVALSADGRLIASGGEDGTVRLWDATSGQQLGALEGHTGTVWRVALSADGRVVASGATDGSVRLWEAVPPDRVGEYEGPGRTQISMHRDGAHPDVWRPLATLTGHSGAIWGLALTGDGRLVASGDENGTVRVWATATGQPVVAFASHSGAVSGVALSADGNQVASAGTDGAVRLWDINGARPLATWRGDGRGIWSVALSADGAVVASGSTDGLVRLWETSTGRPVAALGPQPGAIWSVAVSARGDLVASGGTDGMVRLWQPLTGQPLATLTGNAGGVWGVALSTAGELVASGGDDGQVRVWPLTGVAKQEGRHGMQAADAPTGSPLATLSGHAGAVWRVALSGDGNLVASGGTDGTIRLWEVTSGRSIAVLTGHTGAVWSVALSAAGDLVASGGDDGTVRLWEPRTGRLLTALRGHAGAVWGVALANDGHLLASGGPDGTVRLWDTHTSRELATLRGHAGAVSGVALSADGSLVASGSFDGTVKLWTVQTRTLLRTVRAARRYEQLDITGLTGLTNAQRQALLILGAVDRRSAESTR